MGLVSAHILAVSAQADNDTSPESDADSFGSGAMDHSDSEADAPASPADDDAPLYPLDGKYSSVQDREDLLAKPEIEREQILAERAAEELKKNQNRQLKLALAGAKSLANKHKRKAAAAELEDGRSSRTTRPKTDKVRTALDDLKEARQQKASGQRTTLTSRSARDRRSPSSDRGASDRDADGESEVEWAEPSSSSRHKDEPPAEMRDFERCRVGRSNFAKVCFYPGFDDAIKGCFCRVSIGLNKSTGQNEYRMAQIRGFTEGKAYQMEASNGKMFTTDVYAVVAHGTAEKPWPFLACSDGKLTDQEYDRYIATLKKESLRVPKRSFLHQKLDDIHKLLNTNWTDESIQQKLNNQKKMQEKHDPANVAARKRDAILKKRQQAQEDEDAEEVMKCDAELAALENRAMNMGTTNGSVTKTPHLKSERTMEQDRLARLNEMTRKANTESVRKAQIEERRKLQKAREDAKRKADEKRAAEAVAKAEEEEREGRAKLLGIPKDDMADLFGSDISRTGTPVPGGTPRRSRAGTPMNGVKKEKSGGLLGGLKKKGNMDDDVIGGMDLGIDIEI